MLIFITSKHKLLTISELNMSNSKQIQSSDNYPGHQQWSPNLINSQSTLKFDKNPSEVSDGTGTIKDSATSVSSSELDIDNVNHSLESTLNDSRSHEIKEEKPFNSTNMDISKVNENWKSNATINNDDEILFIEEITREQIMCPIDIIEISSDEDQQPTETDMAKCILNNQDSTSEDQ